MRKSLFISNNFCILEYNIKTNKTMNIEQEKQIIKNK